MLFLRLAAATLVNVELQDHLGLREALLWCNGAQSGIPKVVDRLLAAPTLNFKSVQAFADRYVRQFDRDGNLLRQPEDWVASRCDAPETETPSLSPDAEETPSLDGVDEFCYFQQRLLDAPATTSAASAELSGAGHAVTLNVHQAKLLSDIMHRWLTKEVVDDLHPSTWRIEALLSLTQLLRVAYSFLNFRSTGTLRSKIDALASRLCRLQDIEATTPGLSTDTPITCALTDGVSTYATCHAPLWEPQFDLCNAEATIPDFPDTPCFGPASILQRVGNYGNLRLRAFAWDDTSLTVHLNLSELRPLPALVDAATRNAELFTYLALFRSLVLMYQLVRAPYYHCVAPQIPSVIPGWHTVQVVTVTLPHEPSFQFDPSLNRIPMAVVSRLGCNFAVGIRGTTLRAEWFTNFLIRGSPVPLRHTQHAVGAYGYLSVAQRLLPPLIHILERESAQSQCHTANTKITIYGHSLGSAVAQLLALFFADRYQHTAVTVQGVFFAGPRVFDPETSALYGSSVNGRFLIEMADPLNYVPCHTGNSKIGMQRCGRGHFAPSGDGSDFWHSTPGIVFMDTNIGSAYKAPDMGSEAAAMSTNNTELLDRIALDFLEGESSSTGFALRDMLFSPNSGLSFIYELLSRAVSQLLVPLKALQSIPSKTEFVAAHVASFACALSTACHGLPWSDFRWWCEKLT